MEPFTREPEYVLTLADGTVKQLNPLTGTQVWTVAGRGNRPLGIATHEPHPLDPDAAGAYCAFCEKRYLETPPEKARVVAGNDGGHETHYRLSADQLFESVAEFRRIPNLFEILSYEYWNANYGYTLPSRVALRKQEYLSSPAGLEHVLAVVGAKLRAAGQTQAQVDALSIDERIEAAAGFFGGGHDVIVARHHYVPGATTDAEPSASGTLSPDEHNRFMAFTIEAAKALYDNNRYARYVAVFQNWLKPAGASFDHLHKQLVAIDEHGTHHQATLQRLRANPNLFNEVAVNYASFRNLVIAENDHAVAFAGFGHRYPTIEIYSKSEHCDLWEQSPDEVRGMSDLVHAMHAATGAEVPNNEEWHYRPIDADLPQPWRIMLKWRVSTLAGFEGATRIYLNTIAPVTLRDRVVTRLFALRAAGRLADGIKIAFEAPCKPNSLRYHRGVR